MVKKKIVYFLFYFLYFYFLYFYFILYFYFLFFISIYFYNLFFIFYLYFILFLFIFFFEKIDEEKRAEIDDYLDEYYKLDYEDMIGDMPTRFKYVQVKPNSFNLGVEDILKADESVLNRHVPLNKLAPYRKEYKTKKTIPKTLIYGRNYQEVDQNQAETEKGKKRKFENDFNENDDFNDDFGEKIERNDVFGSFPVNLDPAEKSEEEEKDDFSDMKKKRKRNRKKQKKKQKK